MAEAERFRAACVLAAYDPSAPRWEQVAGEGGAHHLQKKHHLNR
jgi:hypothetical protein